MRQETIKIYSINDLDGSAYTKAIEKVAAILSEDFDLHGDIAAMFTRWCNIIGIYNLEWGWRGFWSQGDGAHFTGRYYYERGWRKVLLEYEGLSETMDEFLAIAERLQDVQRRNFYSIDCDITHRGFYQHELCARVDVSSSLERDVSDEDESEVVECMRDIMRLFYRTLEKEYEFITSEESALEYIEANDIEFYESGEIY
tara:strand:+ start:56 stop:655 length:600 start_codon:yes stop_codon:yes gene_type:complete